MDLNKINYFITLYDTRNFTKASEQLFITRQALSKAMKNLEVELETSLFYYYGGMVNVTPMGECFYSYAKEVVELWNRAIMDIKVVEQENSDELYVGYEEPIYTLWPVDHVDRISKKYKGINIIPKIHIPPCGLEHIINHEVDLFISTFSCDEDQFKTELIQSCRLNVFFRKEDPLAEKEDISLHDLEGRTAYFDNNNPLFYEEFTKFVETEQISLTCKYSLVSGVFPMFALLRETGGIYIGACLFECPQDFVIRPLAYEGCMHLPAQNVVATYLPNHPRVGMIERYIEQLRSMILK